MGLKEAFRSGIKTADSVTKDLQPSVQFFRYTSSDGFGTRTYAAAVSLHAIVDLKQRQIRTLSGELSMCQASVLFLDIAALVAATGGDGVGDNDKIVLTDGKTGPILNYGGFVDAGTGKPMYTEVYLG